MIFIDKMKNLKIYKTPMYLPTVDGDKKKGSAVMLLTPDYISSRNLITNKMLINKMRFQSYYLNPNVSYYINGKVAKGKQAEEYIQEMSTLEMYHSLAEMSAAERKQIPDSAFGLPDKRKYPLDTAEHLKSAIKFFNYVSPEDEEELAHNIIDRMSDYFDADNMPNVGKDNRLSKYLESYVEEGFFKKEEPKSADIKDYKKVALNPQVIRKYKLSSLVDSDKGYVYIDTKNKDYPAAIVAVATELDDPKGPAPLVEYTVRGGYPKELYYPLAKDAYQLKGHMWFITMNDQKYINYFDPTANPNTDALLKVGYKWKKIKSETPGRYDFLFYLGSFDWIKKYGIEESALFESSDEYITERWFITVKDYEWNMGKWKKTDNMLFITGLSGSGKSTKARESTDDASVVQIELDLIKNNATAMQIFDEGWVDEYGVVRTENWINGQQVIKEYLKQYYPSECEGWKPGHSNPINFDDDAKHKKEIVRFLKYILEYAKKNSKKNYVVEGLQIYECDNREVIREISKHPVIAMGTSTHDANLRFSRRERGKRKDNQDADQDINNNVDPVQQDDDFAVKEFKSFYDFWIYFKKNPKDAFTTIRTAIPNERKKSRFINKMNFYNAVWRVKGIKEDTELLGSPSDDSNPGGGKAFHKGTHSYKRSPFGKIAKNNMKNATRLDNVDEAANEHFYFYHLAPKGSDMSKGLTSLQYQYDHKDEMFRHNADKYTDRMVSRDGWNIYPGRDPQSLSDKEIIDGLSKFRGKDGANRIYFFKFPPYSSLGPQMRSILKSKDIYRIDLNDPEVLKWINDIDWGYEGSDTRNGALTRDYYENISPKDYFSEYSENDGKLLFAHMNHISVSPKGGFIPKRLLTKIATPTEMITEAAHTPTGSIDDPYMNPTVVESFGWMNPKNKRYNAIVKLDVDKKNLYRGRSTMMVLSKDRKKIFLADNEGEDKDYQYRMPGGGWDENEDHMFTAIREAREEARLEVTDVCYALSYAEIEDEVKDWVKENIPQKIWWKGYYTEVFVGIHNGSYMGKVEKEDQDERMLATGKFYPIDKVIDKLNPGQQRALKKYLTEYNKQFTKGIKMTHILASGIIRDKDGKMLLEWHNKAQGLVLPSGKADNGENPYQTLVREMREELGITVTEATLNTRYSYQAEYPVGSGNWVIFDEYNYIINSYEGVIENKEPEKHRELVWMDESEIITEGMDLAEELYNYLDYFLHGFTGQPDDVLFAALAQFIWFSGTSTDVQAVKNIFTPQLYFKLLNDDIGIPIHTIRDIPILNIDINPYYAGLDTYYDLSTNEDGYMIVNLHIPYFDSKRYDINEYARCVVYGLIVALLSCLFRETERTFLAYMVADYLTGYAGHGDTYRWANYLFDGDGGELPPMTKDKFFLCMKYGNIEEIYEILANQFGIEYEDLIRDDYRDPVDENSFTNESHLSFSLNDVKLHLGTISEILTEDNTIIAPDTTYLPEEAYIRIGDTITLFEASAQDAKLRQLLYNERIKQRGQLLPILNKVKEEIPEIKYAYPDIDKYKTRNIFVDLYYYNELFFRNNTWEREKGYKLYLELLKRLVNDPEIIRAGYKKRTIFIPVLDWNLHKSNKMWLIRESINPISTIFNMMRLYPEDLKATFGKMDIVFFGRDKYFKINFADIEDPKMVAMKFSMFIKKLAQGEEFDPEDEDTSFDKGSPEQIKADIVDKIEDSKGVDITKNVKARETQKKEWEHDPEAQIDTQKQVEDIKNDDTVKLSKDVDLNKLQQQEDDLNYIASRIEDATADAEDIDDALEKLNSDEEFKEILASLNTIGDDSVKIDATRAARMNKLDQEFLSSNVAGRSVKDILDDKETNKPLEKTSFDIASPNEQWKEMTYVNFDKDYDLDRDIVSCFYHFTKTSKPIAIRSLKAEDNSTSEDRLILYTCEMEDFKGTRFTLKLDIPKMKGNRLRLRGNDKSIQNQLFNMPIIKTEPDTCQIVTNYQKIFIRTYNTVTGRSLPYAGRLIKALKKYEGNKIKVSYGENAKICIKYEVPNDYLDLAGVFSIIETPEKIIYFNQDEIRQVYPDVDDSKGMPYGYDKKTKSILYYKMREISFSEMISRHLCNQDKAFAELYKEAKPSSSGVYSQCSIMSTKIPLVIVCAYTEGLTKVLKKANVEYRLTEKLTPEDKEMIKDGYKAAIRFEDGYLIYTVNYASCMLLNGLDVSGCNNFSMMDIDNRNTYLEMLDQYGGRIKSDGLDNFYDCLVDPISRETLEYYHLPTDFVSILLYANVLLCDNKFIKHTDMASRRVRRTEQIAAYTYEALAEAYGTYAWGISHGRNKSAMAVKQSAVIDKVLASPISGDDSTINALEAAETTNAFTFRGKAGMNEQRSYTLDKRVFDSSMINVLGMSTSYSANVSITRQGTMNMNVDTARGYIKSTNGNTEKMNAANTLAATEAVTPFGSTRDDAPRTLMTFAQTAQHAVVTENSDPMLVTNGADEMLAYTTTDKFAHKAKGEGKVIELTDEYMIIDYGKEKEYINLAESIEKNSNGGYYTPLKLDIADGIKVGSKVKENQIVAYDKKSFSNSVGESDNIAYNNGKLAKVAIFNSHECFEDSGVCAQQFAEKMATKVIDKEDHVLDKDSNVFMIAKIGDHVEPEDALLIWQNPHEEEEANTLLRILGDDQEMVSELGKRTVRSEITGRVADIKIYRTVEIDELSPSLQKIVRAYEKPIKEKKKKLDQLGIESDFLPATYKLEPAGKLKKAQDAVLIEFYLERVDIISVGDKLTNYSANKAIIKNIIPAELMAYTDSRPHEPIDIFVGQISIDKRMVTSTMNYGSIQKLVIETDRTIKDILGIPYDDSKV